MSNTRKAAVPPPPAEFDWDSLVAEPKRATSRISLCFRGDLNAEHQELSAQLVKMSEDREKIAEDRRIGQVDERTPIVERIQEIEAEMQAATHTIELMAMRRKDFRALGLKHPARPGNEVDAIYQANVETLIPVLLAECATTPKRDVEFWQTMVDDVLNDGQYERLVVAVWNVNRADVKAPFSKLASVVTRNTRQRSEPPTGSGSPSDD